MNRSRLLLPLLMLALLLALGLRHRLLALPEVRNVSAPGQFDTPRALARLARVLGDQRPHPVDSAANDAVRARIVGELARIGVEARVTDDVVCNGSADVRTVGCARVRNIVATTGGIGGRPSGREHLLLVSHYDSTPVGPGASDDGIGVSVMLEVADVLARRGVARPVSFLFNEGEEAGLLGARAFVDRDPLAKAVTTIVNMDSRGVEGPAIMFETSQPNGPAIDWYRRSVSTPAANSLSTDFSRLIPNTTDVRVFAERPFTVLNFAVIGNETKYHSPGDRLDALDARSVQHMGDQVLGLATSHAAGRGPGIGTGRRVFADFGGHLLVLPTVAGVAGLGLLLAGALVAGWRRRHGLGRSVLVVLVALTAAAGLAFAGQAMVGTARAGEFWRAYPIAIGNAVMLGAAFASSAALLWIARRADDRTLRTGFWLVFVILGAGVCAVAPGASIFFLLPALFAVMGLLIGGRAERPLAMAAALVLLFSWAPLVALIEMLLDYDNAWIFAPLFAIILLPLLIELKVLAEAVAGYSLAVLGTAALAGWAAVALLPAYSADRKQAFGIEYATQGTTARWLVVNDGAPLPAGFGAFRAGASVPWSARRRWAAPAPSSLARAPELVPLGSRKTADGRVVSFRIFANGTDAVTVLGPRAAGLRAVRMGGSQRRMGSGDGDYTVRCLGRSCEGMRVDVAMANPAPATWTVIGTRAGLPPSARPLITARPANAAPQYTPDAAIGVRTLRF